MKKIFISYIYSKRSEYLELHTKLKDLLTDKFSFEVYAFVFDFKDKVDDKEMMKQAFSKIDEADILIAELSENSEGVCIEAGYAKAKDKKIIYIHKQESGIKYPMQGIADASIIYENIDDLINKISISDILK